ncbi:unnamed protein product [Rotaria sordida]|uniref:Uncharacterized protein n=1 Tax=Rotaria sordida TaxID=392033 RepID=A0A814I3S0_9BILA|nr:unnamed protein product [Rotaria sordida]
MINLNTIVQRIIFIFSIVILFWILFIIIYLIKHLIIRFIKNLKIFHYNNSLLISNNKICQISVISLNQYRSIQPFYHLDSLFLNNKKTHLIINNSLQYQQSKIYLLKHYLNTYNPLQINLIDTHEQTIIQTNVKDIFNEEISSLINTQSIDNCYSINSTNKQKIHETIISFVNEQLSQSSTKITNTILPVIRITDCSNSQRLHTDIIEMNENE